MRQWICAALLLAAAACGDGAPEGNAASIMVPQESPYQERLLAMDPRLRNATFMRAIRDLGESCNRVVQSQPIGHYKNTPVWAARCAGGSEWSLFIAGNGEVQVRDCAHAEQLGLPICRFDGDAGQPSAGSSSSKR